jgi:hypothetical protein
VVKSVKNNFAAIASGVQEKSSSIESDVSRTYKAIVQATSEEEEPLKSFMEEGSAAERARYELTVTIRDFTEELVRGAGAPQTNEILWDKVRIELAQYTRLLSIRMNMDSSPVAEFGPQIQALETEQSNLLLYRAENKIRIRKVDQSTALVLEAVRNNCWLKDILLCVQAGLLDDGNIDADLLRGKVIAQLSAAYEAQIIDCERVASPSI